ncbi:uncharacterized protein Dvar_22990 [Desulfosarcina variabilis str. Montpellier]
MFSQGNIPIWAKAACQQILPQLSGFVQLPFFVYMPQKKNGIKSDLFSKGFRGCFAKGLLISGQSSK